jgi:hypothetical protein
MTKNSQYPAACGGVVYSVYTVYISSVTELGNREQVRDFWMEKSGVRAL